MAESALHIDSRLHSLLAAIVVASKVLLFPTDDAEAVIRVHGRAEGLPT
jgi:hypothetical protein